MSFTGFKKQLNKANQYVSEKIGGAEATKLSQEFVQMETKTDLTCQVVDHIIDKTKEVLYPNPALRAKTSINSKIKGTNKEKYPHPEKSLADSMVKYGNLIGNSSNFGQSLIQTGVTLKEVTEIRYTLEDTVRKKLLEPLTHVQLKDIKDCMHHRKKLEGRRLDYDCKKRKKLKGINVIESDLKTAEDKYNESLKLASVAMQHLLDDNESTQVKRLMEFSEAFYDYHNQCANIFKTLSTRLRRKVEHKEDNNLNRVWSAARDTIDTAVAEANKTIEPFRGVTGFIGMNGKFNKGLRNTKSIVNINCSNNFVDSSRRLNGWKSAHELREKPICRALYDFIAENDEELSFKEGDIIELKEQADDNWFEGTIDGRIGLFPISYVEVLIPLP